MFATKGTVQYYYSLLVVLRQFIIIIARTMPGVY